MSFFTKKSTEKPSEKTLVCWSKPAIFQKLLTGLSSKQSCTKASVIENALIKVYFGKSQVTRDYLTYYLYDDNGSMQRVLYTIFSQAYGHIEFEENTYSNLKPLVEYMRNLFIQPNPEMKLEQGTYRYINRYMDAVADTSESIISDNDVIQKSYLEKLEKRITIPEYQEFIDDDWIDLHKPKHLSNLYEFAKMIRFLQSELKTNYTEYSNDIMLELINLLIAYWDYAKTWRSTYGLLQAVAKQAPWKETPDRIDNLRELIIEVCDEWSEV